jgi:maleylacetoacetate isomerase
VKNPSGQVPAITIDGHTLGESMSIIHYLETTRPEISMIPTNPIDAAKMWQITYLCHSGIQPLQNLPVLAKVEALGGDKMQWGKDVINNGFGPLESILVSTAGTCCIGDNVTIADAVLVAQFYNAARFSVDMTQYPTIDRVVAALKEREEFKAAHPDAMPDCPPPE